MSGLILSSEFSTASENQEAAWIFPSEGSFIAPSAPDASFTARQEVLRLFFAVAIPELAREAVARLQADLRAEMGEQGIRWVSEEQFHFTLKFLGETPVELLPAATEAAREAAAQCAPFPLTLAGIGAFPQQRRPQNLWIGATEGVPLLIRLAECLESGLVARDFAPETRRFNPHLTVARIKSPEGEETVAKHLPMEVATFPNENPIAVVEVKEFVLMRSTLRPTGPVYTVLERFPLFAI